ncbi:Vitamin B6 transporter TPN1 [Madurella mycetomatis]|uniref:Vitamin B6 transporter TPN1 n=1 Tax=Madurella mycetomatis TaxID=100816 RepID=A0A175W9F3_9PEZI|nr:Vitamin B6 transporter TPN1 [Madurella mycetomatis]KXX79634.1 Vitamin B6 transporter TPN1 [Madurella mycetomatis]
MALTNAFVVEKQPYTTSEIIITVNDRASGGPPSQVTVGPRLKVPAILAKLNTRLERLHGFEARGITRVLPSERHPASTMAYTQVFILWFGANISVNNLAVALLGPLVVLRYFMGYWPSKLPTFLNLVLMVGYVTLSFIIAGQMFSAVSGGSLTIAVGIVVVALVCWVVAVFGMKIFHQYERYAVPCTTAIHGRCQRKSFRFAGIPQLLVLFTLIGCAGPYFDTSSQSLGEAPTIAANRLSFLSLCLYVPNSWAAAASDFYVYYPESTPKSRVFLLSLFGLWTSFSFVYLLGIGLATGVTNHASWADANAISTGALIVAGFAPLQGFGLLCSVIVALGVIANSVPGTYSAALGFQVLGRYAKVVPRWVWVTVVIVLQMVMALAGREVLFILFQNFLALMGYWVEFMIVIVALEHVIFRRVKGFDWSRWEDKSYLPVGWAALASFLFGWLGAVLGMYQIWYVGPLAMLSGGADVGVWVGCGFALVTFPPLRWLELTIVGR